MKQLNTLKDSKYIRKVACRQENKVSDVVVKLHAALYEHALCR